MLTFEEVVEHAQQVLHWRRLAQVIRAGKIVPGVGGRLTATTCEKYARRYEVALADEAYRIEDASREARRPRNACGLSREGITAA